MSDRFPALVEHLDATRTVAIVTGDPAVATPIWAVVVDGVPVVRSAYGPDAAWYRRALESGRAEFTLGDGRVAERDRTAALRDERVPVTVRSSPVDDPLRERVDAAFGAKYGDREPESTAIMVREPAISCTLVVEPVGD